MSTQIEDEFQLAFSFTAAEFLEEEAECDKINLGYEHPMWKNGKYVENPNKQHRHEWWAKSSDIKAYNKLINKLNKLKL